jgi:hypothetical protein
MGVRKPAATPTPAAASIAAESAAWSLGLRIPSLANQRAVPSSPPGPNA